MGYLKVKSPHSARELTFGPGNRSELYRRATELRDAGMTDSTFTIDGVVVSFAEDNTTTKKDPPPLPGPSSTGPGPVPPESSSPPPPRDPTAQAAQQVQPRDLNELIMLQQHEAILRSLQINAAQHEIITQQNAQMAEERLALFKLSRAQAAADHEDESRRLQLRRQKGQVQSEEWIRQHAREKMARPSGFDTLLESIAQLVAVHTQTVIIPKVDP